MGERALVELVKENYRGGLDAQAAYCVITSAQTLASQLGQGSTYSVLPSTVALTDPIMITGEFNLNNVQKLDATALCVLQAAACSRLTDCCMTVDR